MNTKTIKIDALNSNVNESQNMLLKLIDSQVNNYKIERHTQWLRDNTACAEVYNENIKQLEAKKAEILELIAQCDSDDYSFDFNISIDVEVKSSMKLVRQEVYA